MPKTNKITIIRADGVKIQCLPEQAASVMASFTGQVGVVAGKLPYKSSKDIRNAVRNITGDTASEYVMNILKANVTNGYGLHTVYSGLNHNIREKYADDPQMVTEALRDNGLITIRPAKGGAIIDLPKVK